jgi:tRNA(fMet)-specific endonuclease VapC
MIVLDTSALIDLFRGSDALHKVLNDDAASTVVTYHEIFSGIKHRRARAEEKFFRRFFSNTHILCLDIQAAERSSEIMARLLNLGVPVNAFDVLIAGIAVSNGAERLVTKDRDFEKIAMVAEIEVVIY